MATKSSSNSPPFPTLLQHPLSSTSQLHAADLANAWILEFLLRQPVPDSLISEIFLSLPFSSPELHPHIRKSLLLRRILSDLRRRCLSERALHSLQIIADLDRQRGFSPSHRLKAAYCAAAVECTSAAFLRSGEDFMEAVEKIWMADAAECLVSDQFLEWGKRYERCISSGEGCEEILRRDVEVGMNSVRDYVEEALTEMGPPFLQILAVELEEKRMDLDENDGPGKGCKSFVESGFRSVEMEAEANERGVNVGGNDLHIHSGYNNIHPVDPGEVKKVKDALKNSWFDLNMAVEDPLPEAQAVAAAILADLSRGHVLFNETEKQSFMEKAAFPVPPIDLVAGTEKQSFMENSAFPVPPIGLVTGTDTSTRDLEKEKRDSSDLKEMEGNLNVKACDNDAGPSKRSDVAASHSLFERNPTAHTCEWSDDSVESSASLEKCKSPNPMPRRISPHKGNLVRRRVVRRWTPQEEHTLRKAVAKHGKGNWKLILNCHSEIFEERTEVDLKDKWRNMTRHL